MIETPSFGHEVSAFSSPKDIEDAQQKIDEEIRVLEENIRDMKLRRNGLLSLIFRLILAIIFKCLKAVEASVAFDMIFRQWEYTSPPQYVEDAQQKFDEEILEVEKSSRDLKTRRNDLALVARLPPEILATIFKCFEMVSSRWSHIIPSHVCSHWRRVALECPSLWARLRIDVAPIHWEWVQEMLERSKSAPLTLYAEFAPCSKDAVLSVLTRANMDRIQNLSLVSLRIDDRADQELLKVLETHQAPLLEHLMMAFRPTSGAVINDPPNIHFTRHSPCLHVLKLLNCTVSWAPSSVPNRLTSLTIFHTSFTVMNQFITTLSNIPTLVTLELELSNIPPSTLANSQAGRSSQTITLPNLSKIVIKSDLSSCVHFLCRLSFPGTSSINIYSSTTFTLTNLLVTFCTIFSTDRCLGARQPIRHFKMELQESSSLFEAWSISGSNWNEPVADPQFVIALNSPWEFTQPWHGREADFWDVLPLDALESLQLCLWSDIPKDAWLDLCSHLDQLVILSVDGFSVDGLIKALSIRQTEQRGEHILRTHPLYLPALRELSISGEFDLEYAISRIRRLKKCLKRRRKVSVGIQKLRLHISYRILQIDITELNGEIPGAFWDEVINDLIDYHKYDHDDDG